MTIIFNGTQTVTTPGLSISTSNILTDRIPTVTSAGAGEVPANISDPDHSLNYTSSPAAELFTVNYGFIQNISYVAISGQTSAGALGSTIKIYDGITPIDSVTTSRNHNIMFTFEATSFTELIIEFETSQLTQQVTVSFIAAGSHLQVSTGEQAGYSRAWLLRHTDESVTTNLLSAPIGATQKNKPMKGSLSLPNQEAVFSQGLWQTFIDFSYQQPFFIKEVDSMPESSYICFDPKHSIKAHPQTRLLDAIMLKFTAYNGL